MKTTKFFTSILLFALLFVGCSSDKSGAYQMVFVEGGSFMMGCDEKSNNDCQKNELPMHEVNVESFYIGKYEVTQRQWKDIMDTNISNNQCEDCPVTNVSYNEIQEFLQRLRQKTGINYRLPTEQEWEYAAKGGIKKNTFKYSGSDNLSDVAWYINNSDNITHKVGTKKANEIGIYDMSGNVWEYTSTPYRAYGEANEELVGQNSDSNYYAIRGGCFDFVSQTSRIVYRGSILPNVQTIGLGFRLAYDETEAQKVNKEK
ncbi:MAG: formylglycine-generating enzyme family protein [Bacteroidales bacterium]|jgi:formylglycine-generating enzyme required for sulfatase activity|nr:formylglycine-generating enzyme family protein [Bacteroidales bacterium]